RSAPGKWRVSTSAALPVPPGAWRDPAPALLTLPLRFLHFWIGAPAALFLLALTAMLLRPPDLKTFPVDRLAFVVLVCAVGLRICLRRERLSICAASWPIAGLLLLGACGVLTQPYDPQAWSLLAAK